MSYCYILYSKTLSRFYIGSTHTTLEDRLLKHNRHLYGKQRYTAKADDWEIFLSIQVKEYAHAVRIERKIKSMKSSVYIRNLKKYPSMVEKIIEDTRT